MTDLARSSAHGYPVVQGIQLRSTHELPDRLRSVFKHPVFNAVQSKCFDTVFNSDDNFVLSAPTSSGKTAVLELAICRLIVQSGPNDNYKIIYQAPTKSLCAERQQDWQTRFCNLGLKCAELTGDTDQSQLHYAVQHADIIVTTPEKWDSMTRKWKDHDKLMKLVKLFLIDEVHILNDDRGASLEAVVSRMKSIGSSVRFVALSATVPNSDDIATWLGRNSKMQHVPAAREVFGEKFRPVKLTKYVVGIQAHGMSDFAMEATCTKQLPDIISTYGKERKPIMIFCFTRASTENTAKVLAAWWKSSKDMNRFWTAMPAGISVGNATLADCTKAGVAFHHAGMDPKDRTAVEKGYLNGDLNVICCTSTLAVGVNLPCHMVIIKNTVTYHADGCKEYSDLEIMQMLGRAGRPQFDKSGVAVILTRQEKVERYEKMVSGQEILESRLHHNLIDHLNAEIGLGTVFDDKSAKAWLEGTFFFVRYRQNPERYRLEEVRQRQNADQVLDNVCSKDLGLLRACALIVDEGESFSSTEFGDAMARYYVHFNTMKLILGLQSKPRLSEILSVIAQADEFKSIRFRSGEKQMFKEINSSPSIKFAIKVDLALPAHKVSLIIQAILGGIDLRNDDRYAKHGAQFASESALIFQHVHRLIRCIIDCQLQLEDSVGARNALGLARSLGASAWDDSPLQLLQVDQIGQVAVRKLVSHGIKTIEDLENTEAHKIEMYLSKNPPFGTTMLSKLKSFPKLRVNLKLMGKPVSYCIPIPGCCCLQSKVLKNTAQGKRVQVNVKAELGFINEKPPETFMRKTVHVILLAETSDGHKVHFHRTSGKKLGNGQVVLFAVDLLSPSQFINCYISCDDIAGTLREARLDPKIPSAMFPANLPSEERTVTRTTRVPVPKRGRATHRTVSTGSREFEDADIGDDDLVAAGDECFADIDEVDLTCETSVRAQTNSADPKMQRKSTQPNAAKEPAQEREWKPTRLPNGKWMCRHGCRDKANCHHVCCKEGLDKPPRMSKPVVKDDNASNPVSENRKTKTTMDNFVQSRTDAKSTKSTSQKRGKTPVPKFPYPDRPLRPVSPSSDLDGESDILEEGNELSPSAQRDYLGHEGSGLFLHNTTSPEKFTAPPEAYVDDQYQMKRPNETAYEDIDELTNDRLPVASKRRKIDDTSHGFVTLRDVKHHESYSKASVPEIDDNYNHNAQLGESEFDIKYSDVDLLDDDFEDLLFETSDGGMNIEWLGLPAGGETGNDLFADAATPVAQEERISNVVPDSHSTGYTDLATSQSSDVKPEKNDALPVQPNFEAQSEKTVDEVDAWLIKEFGDFVEFV